MILEIQHWWRYRKRWQKLLFFALSLPILSVGCCLLVYGVGSIWTNLSPVRVPRMKPAPRDIGSPLEISSSLKTEHIL